VGIGIPVDLPKRILTLGLNFQFQYLLPTNFTLLRQYPEIQSRKLREAVNRETTYQALQTVMERRVTSLSFSTANSDACKIPILTNDAVVSFSIYNRLIV
jgi:hypothetical protein